MIKPVRSECSSYRVIKALSSSSTSETFDWHFDIDCMMRIYTRTCVLTCTFQHEQTLRIQKKRLPQLIWCKRPTSAIVNLTFQFGSNMCSSISVTSYACSTVFLNFTPRLVILKRRVGVCLTFST